MKYKILRTIKQMPVITEAIVNLCARVDQVSLFISSPSASANLACKKANQKKSKYILRFLKEKYFTSRTKNTFLKLYISLNLRNHTVLQALNVGNVFFHLFILSLEKK